MGVRSFESSWRGEALAFSVNRKFHMERIPGKRDVYHVEICRLPEPTSGTRVRRDYLQRRVVSGHANGEQAAEEGAIHHDFVGLMSRRGKRMSRRASRESLLKRLKLIRPTKSPAFSLRFIRIYVTAVKKRSMLSSPAKRRCSDNKKTK